MGDTQHVNLRLSVVTEVVLELASLQTLDLRECSALTHLRLECPSLNALHLQGCLALPATSIKVRRRDACSASV